MLDSLVSFVLSDASSVLPGVTGAIVSVSDSTFSGVTDVFHFAIGVSVMPLSSLSDWPVASTLGEVVVWSLVMALSVSESSWLNTKSDTVIAWSFVTALNDSEDSWFTTRSGSLFPSSGVFSISCSRSSLLHLLRLAACLLADGPALGGGEYVFLFLLLGEVTASSSRPSFSCK